MHELQRGWTRFWQVVIVIAAILSMVATAVTGLNFVANQEGEAVARSYSVPCYMEQGGAKFVASSGCEVEVQSGATFDLQSGATTDFSGGVDLDGASLVVDADGDTIIVEGSDDVISTTLGAGTGKFAVYTGNLVVGDEAPTITQDGEDAYIEGQFEVDGEAQFDGAIDANSSATFDGGLVDIGGGSYDTASGDNDLGVAGVIEVDGELEVDGAIDVDSTSDFNDTATFSKATGNAIVVTAGGNIDANGTSDFNDTATFSKGSGDALVISAGGKLDNLGTMSVDGLTDLDDVDIDLSAALNIDGHMVDIGGGTYDTASGDDDLGVAGVLEVDGELELDGALDADSSATFDGGLVDIGGGTYDTASGDNDLGVAGVLEVDGEFEADGAIDADSTSDFNDTATFSKATGNAIVVTAGGNIDANGTSDFNDTATFSKGSGDALVISAGGKLDNLGTMSVDGLTDLDDVDIDLSAALNIDGHMVDIGGGSYDTATGDDDLGVAGAVEIDGELEVDGAIDADSTSDFGGNVTVSAGSVTVSAGDVTISPAAAGGNEGARNEYSGLPRILLVGGAQGTDPGGQTIDLVDDSPTGEYAPVDADVTEAEGSVTSVYKVGASSYAATFLATAEATDGFLDAALGGDASWEDMESVGMWVYSTETLASGDLTLVLTDDGGDRTFDIPAVSVANTWTWLEVDITSLDAGTGDTISDVAILMSAAGAIAMGEFTFYLDEMWVWDVVDEEALNVAVIQDGVLSVIDTEGGVTLAEWTDYIVHYEAAADDFIVYITNQSAADIAVLAAY